MAVHFPELAARVRSQRELQPDLYGDVDFDATPHRLANRLEDTSSLPRRLGDRAQILADSRLVELMSTGTKLGDVVADPYASLMASRSFKGLIGQLETACRQGLDAVPDAPPELEAFIAAMEASPEWLDMDRVREGARLERIPSAWVAPYVVRGAFVATFMNTYAALPMALTGVLGGQKAARRVHETASFFAVTTLPGALDRHGPGFEAAAKVRLMHSMVRYNALKRSGRWDLDVHGIPIPQVDQMPAGLLNVYVIATEARRRGREHFTDHERSIVEFSRYRCFLLGLPEELLPTTIDETLELLHARAALLRDGFDDACRALVEATMDCRLRAGDAPLDRIAEAVEKSFSKAFFVNAFAGGRRATAEEMGVTFTDTDRALVALTAPLVFGRYFALRAAGRTPVLRELTDVVTTFEVKRRLASYGKPQFTTDASTYAPVVKDAAVAVSP